MFRAEEVLLVTPETETEELILSRKFPYISWIPSCRCRTTFVVSSNCVEEVKKFIEEKNNE